MSTGVAALREEIIDALRVALPGYNVFGGTPYGVEFTATDQRMMAAGKVLCAFVGEIVPDAVHAVGGLNDLSARCRVEMYRQSEADLDAGSWPTFEREIVDAAVAVNGLDMAVAVATVSSAPRAPFIGRICHRAELLARFIKLCAEEA